MMTGSLTPERDIGEAQTTLHGSEFPFARPAAQQRKRRHRLRDDVRSDARQLGYGCRYKIFWKTDPPEFWCGAEEPDP